MGERVLGSGMVAATIGGNGDMFLGGSLSQNSDLRLKAGVDNLNYGLRQVLKLRPVTWFWKKQPERGIQLGLIAQEVEPVLPELVTSDKEGDQIKRLNYIGLLPIVIKAMQEQQRQIEQQQQEIETLKQQRQEVEALKSLICADHADVVVCKSN